MVAHGLAKQVLSVRQMEIWMEDAPTFILHAIQADVTHKSFFQLMKCSSF